MIAALLRRALLAAVLVAASGRIAAAQGGSVAGSVTDSAGTPIAGTEIAASGTAARTYSDARGEYRLVGVPFGDATIVARRLGFRPETLRVAVGENATPTHFVLRFLPTLLEAVAVRGRHQFSGRLAGYYERLYSRTQGYFITRDDIDRGSPRQLTDVLRRAPGVEIVRGSRLRLRGRSCAPLVWIDGVSMPAGEVELNSFAPNSIEGIEIYMTASGAPGRYQGTGDESRCGTLLLWSRGLDTEQRRAPIESASERLARLVESGEVLTSGEVESEARPADSARLAIIYPPDLFSEGIGGLVVAEFVVDSAGRMEPQTFNVVASPHLLLARAVYEGVEGASFTPGRKGGRAIRQVVQMRFRFAPPGGH